MLVDGLDDVVQPPLRALGGDVQGPPDGERGVELVLGGPPNDASRAPSRARAQLACMQCRPNVMSSYVCSKAWIPHLQVPDLGCSNRSAVDARPNTPTSKTLDDDTQLDMQTFSPSVLSGPFGHQLKRKMPTWMSQVCPSDLLRKTYSGQLRSWPSMSKQLWEAVSRSACGPPLVRRLPQ